MGHQEDWHARRGGLHKQREDPHGAEQFPVEGDRRRGHEDAGETFNPQVGLRRAAIKGRKRSLDRGGPRSSPSPVDFSAAVVAVNLIANYFFTSVISRVIRLVYVLLCVNTTSGVQTRFPRCCNHPRSWSKPHFPSLRSPSNELLMSCATGSPWPRVCCVDGYRWLR